MKSGTSMWGIMTIGVLSVVAFGSIGLWNQNNPLFKARGHLWKEFKVLVERTDIKRHDNKITSVEITINNKEPISNLYGKRLGLESFKLFLELQKCEHLKSVVIITKEKQRHVAQRLEALSYRKAREHIDRIRLFFIKEKLPGATIEVVSANSDGAVVIVALNNPSNKNDNQLASRVKRRILKTPQLPIGEVDVRIFGKDGKQSLRRRFDSHGKIIKEATPKIAPPKK